jgi:predicted glycoside hydrolase/deacetylase ChbG (UPF0249 family)
VNRGIIDAHETGSVTSASLLANASPPDFADAIARAHRAPRLGVGLHANFTAGSPVAPRADVASLWNPRTGAFYPLTRLVRRALAGQIAPRQVAIECAAQLARLRSVGIAVTHIDSHRHVHVLPGIWRAVVTVARQAGVRAVRVPREPGVSIKQLCLGAAWIVASRGDRGDDVRLARQFRGLSLMHAPDYERALLRLLDDLPLGVTELMVHPGYAEADLAARDGYAGPRERELAALQSAVVLASFTRRDITLCHFGQL